MSTRVDQNSVVRRSKRWQTLRFKLYAMFVSLFLVGTGLAFLHSLRFFETLSIFTRQQTHSDVAQEIAEEMQPLIDSGAPFSELKQVGDRAARYNPDFALYLIDERGQVLGALSPHTWILRATAIPIPPVEEFLNSPLENLPIYNTDPRDGRPRAFSAARVRYLGKPAYLYLTIDGSAPFDRARGVAREDGYTFHGLLLVFGSHAVALLLGLVAVSLLSIRFERITSVVRQYGEGKLDGRLQITSNDEIDELAGNINQMASKIQSNIDELKRRDELRRELIANISHDLLGPTSHIKIAAEELQSQDATTGPGNDAPQIAALGSSVKALEAMLQELFDLAKFEAHEIVAVPKYFPIEEVFDDLSLRFHGEVQKKSLSLTFSTAENLPPVYADPALIGRALVNLIGNAVRYTPTGGSIGLTAVLGQKGVLVTVSDTGVGISNEESSRLFERFYRGGEHRPKTSGSSGLGLAITKRIIELHGSTIELESVVGKGSHFWFELPSEPLSVIADSHGLRNPTKPRLPASA